MFKCKECGSTYNISNAGGIAAHLKKHNITKLEYAKKYYKIIGDETNTYKVNHEKQELTYLGNKSYNCPICSKSLTTNSSYIESHIKRIHGITDYFNDFYLKYYQWENEDEYIEYSKKGLECGICNERLIDFSSRIIANHETKKFYFNCLDGYTCNTKECREISSKLIFNAPYNKKTHEHIGCNAQYLSLKYKENLQDSKLRKVGPRDYSKPITCSLKDYKERYGDELGEQLYNERNRKIANANSLEWYIERHGIDKGPSLYNERQEKTKRAALGTCKSKISEEIGILLSNEGIKFKEEYFYNKSIHSKRTDFYLIDYNTHIEFYGDYWHANPKYFDKDRFHKTLKVTASEIWERDKARIDEILSINDANVIIIWEATFNTYKKENRIEHLLELIKGFLNAKFKRKSISI